MPTVDIAIPTALRGFTGGAAQVPVQADTVREALDRLIEAHPRLGQHLRTADGALRSFVNVYLGDEDIRFIEGGEDARVPEGASLMIVPSIAGGASGDPEDPACQEDAEDDTPATVRPVWERRLDELPELEPFDYARYSRHLILEDVGVEGQRRLKGASVLCVGSGGLGSPLLLYLAAAGVGRIGIVDFDVVDESNLQRQVIHGSSTVGRPKLESARERILDINPRCRVDLYPVALDSSNALEILAPYDVVVDGTDNFPTRYLVNDACVLLDKPNVYGSIFKFEGQASVFNYTPPGGERGPHYRDLYPEPPPPGLVPSCAEGGVLGILPGVIGCIQATETIKILLGRGTSLSGRLLLYDALSMKFRELKLRRDPNAPKITRLIDYKEFCGVPSIDEGAAAPPPEGEGFGRMSVREARDRLDSGWQPFILDVRKPHELDIVRFPGTHLQRNHEAIVAGDHQGIPRDRPVLVTCRSGARSATAAGALVAAGYPEVYNLEGGILAWADEIDPSLPKY